MNLKNKKLEDYALRRLASSPLKRKGLTNPSEADRIKLKQAVENLPESAQKRFFQSTTEIPPTEIKLQKGENL